MIYGLVMVTKTLPWLARSTPTKVSQQPSYPASGLIILAPFVLPSRCVARQIFVEIWLL
jgi:hypothetical protein